MDRNGHVAFTATALTFTLIDGSTVECIRVTTPAYMRLKRRMVDRSGGRRDTTITTGGTKGVEAGVLSPQERRRTCATLDRVDKGIESFSGHVRLWWFLESRRGTSGSRRSRGERGKGRYGGWISRIGRTIVTWCSDEGSETSVKSDGDLIQGLIVRRKDADGFGTACPVRELSIRPARESEDRSAGESDVPCRTIRIRMGQRFERIIRVGYVDSENFFDNLDFDEEVEGAGTRGS